MECKKTAIQKNSTQQSHNLYIIAETNEGIILIDQHAAHERILFEQFSYEFHTLHKKTINLAKPQLLSLSVTESQVVEEHNKFFKNLGFSINHFQGNTYKITSVPELLQDRDLSSLISEIIEDLMEEKNNRMIDSISKRMTAYIACHAAIKKGETLTQQQCQILIEKLEQTKNNETCPHGRPTKVEVSLNEINRWFKRK